MNEANMAKSLMMHIIAYGYLVWVILSYLEIVEPMKNLFDLLQSIPKALNIHINTWDLNNSKLTPFTILACVKKYTYP